MSPLRWHYDILSKSQQYTVSKIDDGDLIVDVYDHFVPFHYLLATPADLLPLNFAISDFNCFQMIKHTSTGTCQKMRYTNQSIIRRPNARL